MKLRPSCVLFDLDGTLVDSAPDLGYAANCVRQERDLEPLSIDEYRPFASGGARGLLGAALSITPEDHDYAHCKTRFLAHYEEHLASDSRLFDGVPELLDTLEDVGIRWGIVTNKVEAYALPLLDCLGLRNRSACVVSGDSTPHPKPAPDAILLACEQINLAPRQCIYVGDDLRDIVAGHAAKMTTVIAAWGYLGVNPDLKSWAADFTAESPQALGRLIELRRAA